MDKLQFDDRVKEIRTLVDEGNYIEASLNLTEYSRDLISLVKDPGMKSSGKNKLRASLEDLADLSFDFGKYFRNKDDSESDKYFRIAEAALQAIRDHLFIYDEKVMLALARIYHREEDYDRAREFYVKVYDLCHDHTIQLNIADCLLESEQYNEACKILNNISGEIENNDNKTVKIYLSILAKLSDLYVSAGENDMAIKCYRKALSFFNKIPAGMDDEVTDAGYSIMKTLVSLLILKEKFSESLKVIRRTENKFRHKRQQAMISNLAGESYLEMNELHKAMRCFEKAYSLEQDKLFNDNMAKTFNRMGLECYDRQDYVKAAEHFSRAFILDDKIEYQISREIVMKIYKDGGKQ